MEERAKAARGGRDHHREISREDGHKARGGGESGGVSISVPALAHVGGGGIECQRQRRSKADIQQNLNC